MKIQETIAQAIVANTCMLNLISANSVLLSIFRLIISALLLVLSASSVKVGLPAFVNQSVQFMLDYLLKIHLFKMVNSHK